MLIFLSIDFSRIACGAGVLRSLFWEFFGICDRLAVSEEKEVELPGLLRGVPASCLTSFGLSQTKASSHGDPRHSQCEAGCTTPWNPDYRCRGDQEHKPASSVDAVRVAYECASHEAEQSTLQGTGAQRAESTDP